MQTYRKTKTQIAGLLVLCSLAVHVFAAERTGRVCVQAIPMGASWKGNETGAKETITFKVQIDNRRPIPISTNSSGVFTNLSLVARHVVKIQLDDKPLASFRFSFRDEQSEHLRLWYNPFYGTWSLWPVRQGEKCACPNKPP